MAHRANKNAGKAEVPRDSGSTRTNGEEEWTQTGLCAEAQADGVPCYELGRYCETCERARAGIDDEGPRGRKAASPRKPEGSRRH